MAVSQEFKDKVASGSLLGVRIMLANCLLVDKTFVAFNERVRYAQAQGMDIWVKSDAPLQRQPKAEWNEEVLDLELVRLKDEFTQDRAEYCKDLIRYLYPASQKPAYSPLSSGASQPYRWNDSYNVGNGSSGSRACGGYRYGEPNVQDNGVFSEFMQFGKAVFNVGRDTCQAMFGESSNHRATTQWGGSSANPMNTPLDQSIVKNVGRLVDVYNRCHNSGCWRFDDVRTIKERAQAIAAACEDFLKENKHGY